MRLAADRGWPAKRLDDFAQWRDEGQLDQKRIDAFEMLSAVPAHLAAGVTPLEISYTLEDTATWQRARRGAVEFAPISIRAACSSTPRSAPKY